MMSFFKKNLWQSLSQFHQWILGSEKKVSSPLKKPRSRLQVEGLESRELMAANLMDVGDLVAPAAIFFEPVAKVGEYVVEIGDSVVNDVKNLPNLGKSSSLQEYHIRSNLDKYLDKDFMKHTYELNGDLGDDYVYHVNGQNTPLNGDATKGKFEGMQEAEALSIKLGRPVRLIHNATATDRSDWQGESPDFVQSMGDRLWNPALPQNNFATRQVAGMLYYHAERNEQVSISSHSQGNIIVRNAIWTLNAMGYSGWVESKIRWLAMGNPLRDFEMPNVESRHNINNELDPINAIGRIEEGASGSSGLLPNPIYDFIVSDRAEHNFVKSYAWQAKNSYFWPSEGNESLRRESIPRDLIDIYAKYIFQNGELEADKKVVEKYRLAEVYAHVNNALRSTDRKQPESVKDAVASVLNADPQTTKTVIKSMLLKIDGNAYRNMPEVMAHMKSARLVVETGSPESFSGHLSWAEQSFKDHRNWSKVGDSIEKSIETIDKKFKLAIGEVKIALAADGNVSQAFGYVKNALRVAQGKSAEAMAGHISWASQQKDGAVKDAIGQLLKDLVALGIKAQNYAEVFGHMKNAALTVKGGAAEALSGHMNWAQGQFKNDGHWGDAAKAIDGHIKTLESTLDRNFVSGKMWVKTDQRLADIFAYTKNALLRIQGKAAEAHNGHVNWALNNASRDEVLDKIQEALATIASKYKSASRSNLNDAFGYLKQASKYSVGETNETVSGHINWAGKQKSASTVQAALKDHHSALVRYVG